MAYPEREHDLDIKFLNSLFKIYIIGAVKASELDKDDEEGQFQAAKPFYDFVMGMSNGQKFKMICDLFDRLFELDQDVTSMLNEKLRES
jgi:hypothetical protein